MLIWQSFCMGCIFAVPLLSESTKEEILEGVEVFVGGSVAVIASSWLTTWLSNPLFLLSDIMIKGLTGGITSLLVILLSHLLRRILMGGKGHDHKEDQGLTGGYGASLSGGGVRPQGGCCQGCSLSFCNSLAQRRKKQVTEEKEIFSMAREERFLNSKDILPDAKQISKGCDLNVMWCDFTSDSPPVKKSSYTAPKNHNTKWKGYKGPASKGGSSSAIMKGVRSSTNQHNEAESVAGAKIMSGSPERSTGRNVGEATVALAEAEVVISQGSTLFVR